MQEQQYELSVGDVVQIGDRLVTVIDIDGADVSFRIDTVESEDPIVPISNRTMPPPK